MTDESDPPSTHCNFLITLEHPQLFRTGATGDRIELRELRDGRLTGVVLTARVLKVDRPETSGSHRIG